MGINIKNPETERLIRELAKLAGEGQTEAVTLAVAERLARIRASRRKKGLAERLTALLDDMAPRFKPPFDTIDHGDLLYDDKTGLPK